MRLFAFLLVCLWSLACVAKNATLSENDALTLFYQRNLDLIAAKYNIERARAQQIIDAAIPNPVISWDVTEISRRADFKHLGPATIVRIDQLIVTAGKRRLRMEGSALAAQAAEQDLRDAIRTFSNTVRHAFYSLLLAQKTGELAQDNRARFEEILRANHLRVKTGDIAESDFLRIEVEGLKVQSDLDNAMASVKQARAELAVLLGWPDNARGLVAQNAWLEPKDSGQDRGEDALIEKAIDQRPDLQAAKLRIEQSEKALELARRVRIPDVTIGADYSNDPSNNVRNSYGLGISIPLPIFYRQKGEIGQAVVDLNSAKLDFQRAEQSIHSDVVSSLAVLSSADAIVKRFRQEVLKRIETIRKTAEFAYSRGATSILDLLEAERNYKALMLEYYNALNSRSTAYADLLKAVGEEAER